MCVAPCPSRQFPPSPLMVWCRIWGAVARVPPDSPPSPHTVWSRSRPVAAAPQKITNKHLPDHHPIVQTLFGTLIFMIWEHYWVTFWSLQGHVGTMLGHLASIISSRGALV